MGGEYRPLPQAAASAPGSGQQSPTQKHQPQQPLTGGWEVLRVAAWVAFWIVNSVSIIIVNKHVISFSGFHFPITLALWHMLLGSVTSRAAMRVFRIKDTIREHASPALYAQVGLVGVLFGATLVTGNAALRLLTVPTVQMLKASGPATIYFAGILMGTEKLGLSQTVKVAVVCLGVGIASWGDITLTLLGFVLQVISIACDATRCCALQKVLQTNHIDAGPLVTLSHVAPFALAALTLPALMNEGPRLLSDYNSWRGAIPMVLLSGLLASILNFVVFKIIRLTSALTTSLSGVLKEWACILVAMYVYGTHVTQLQWVGYSVAIAGLMWYQSGRLRAAQAKACPATTVQANSSNSNKGADSAVVINVSASSRNLPSSASADGSRSGSAIVIINPRGSSSWGSDDGSQGVVAVGGTSSSSRLSLRGGSGLPALRVKL